MYVHHRPSLIIVSLKTWYHSQKEKHGGAEAARGAHNPEVNGSKPFRAIPWLVHVVYGLSLSLSTSYGPKYTCITMGYMLCEKKTKMSGEGDDIPKGCDPLRPPLWMCG